MTDPSTPVPVTMSQPSRWLAVLRIGFGFWFFKALWTKLDVAFLGGVMPWLEVEARWTQVMPDIITRQMAENPIGWYRDFVQGTVLPHASTFAAFTAWGEALTGVSLVFGVGSGLGALGALFLSVNYALATWHMSAASQGFHYLLILVSLVLFLARSGRAWGLDAWIAWRWPGAWVSRWPIA
jgi:uncharacterized membrane protein YphA (DoxX/SURF4 family)